MEKTPYLARLIAEKRSELLKKRMKRSRAKFDRSCTIIISVDTTKLDAAIKELKWNLKELPMRIN